jgi:hypothetical protein
MSLQYLCFVPKLNGHRGFQNVTNHTYSKQINLLSTFVKILLIFFTELHVTLPRRLVHVVA